MTWLILVSTVEMARVVGSCLVCDVGMFLLSGCVETMDVGKELLWIITICHSWFSLTYTSRGTNIDDNRI